MERRDARRLALGSILKLWREGLRKVTQKELERAVGLSAERVSKLERGKSDLRGDEMDRIAGYFNTTAAHWIELARPIEDDLVERAAGLVEGGDYAAPVVAPGSLVDGDAPKTGLPRELQDRWEQQRAEEHRVRKNRDDLTFETNAYLYRNDPARR